MRTHVAPLSRSGSLVRDFAIYVSPLNVLSPSSIRISAHAFYAHGILDNVSIKACTVTFSSVTPGPPLVPSSLRLSLSLPAPSVLPGGRIINRSAAVYYETTRSILGHDRSPVIRLVCNTVHDDK